MALFISFEGPDGSGKSTQAAMLAASLRGQGYRVTETREPGGTELGERIRELVLSPESPSATPLAMTFLLSAARTQLLHEVILPALACGDIVIADRFADSTLAYQSCGLGLDAGLVRQVTAIATGGRSPDVTIYVDVPVETGMARAVARGQGNRLDTENAAFHDRVRTGYLQLMAAEPGRWIDVDGAAPPETVHRAIMERLETTLQAVYTG